MSQETRKPGRPPGQSKTGGRKKGTPNKKNIRMRDRFERAGFDFAMEFIAAYKAGDFERLDVLKSMAAYFMQRLREDTEETPTPAPQPDSKPEDTDLSTAQLLSIVKPQ